MKPLVLSLTILGLFVFPCWADDAPEKVATQLSVLLEATQNNDLDTFESVCDEKMQEAMTAELLTNVSKQVSALMKSGYQPSYMGHIDKLSHKTYYWKVDFDTDNAPDLLAVMTIANGKVAGFILR